MIKKYHKVIAYIVLVILSGLSIYLGVNFNSCNEKAKDWFGDLDKRTVATAPKATTVAVPSIPNVNMETYTLEIELGSSSVIPSEAESDVLETDATDNEIVGYFTLNSSWDGHYLYNVSVENIGDRAVSEWQLSVILPNGATVSDFWCCNCELTENVLVITPLDYNKNISNGGRITEIGITIVSDVPLENLTVNGNGEVIQKESDEETETYIPPVLENGTPLSNHGNLSLDGTKLVDMSGKPFQLKGVSTHGIGWFPEYVNKEAFRTLRDEWGANTVRIAMYTAEYNGFCTGGSQEDLKQIVDNGVQYATDLGLYVIIDWHILSDSNPNTYKSQALKFFEEMSAKYCNYDNVIYEICNEPNGGVDWNTIKNYADEVISVIRKHDEDAIILVGTPTWSQDIDQVAANPVSNGYNVMYTLHFYAATHKDNIRNKLVTALNAGTPAFISEFSICDASGNGGIDYASANEWKNLINQYNLSYAGWSLSNKAETSALIKNSCTKKSDWSVEDLSDTGKWLREMIAGQ